MSDINTTVPATMNVVQRVTTEHRNLCSAPPVAMDTQEAANIEFGHAHDGTQSLLRDTGSSVNDSVLTSRSASLTSSFSRSDTLVDLCAAGSTTIAEATNPSVAERRLQFKEEFEFADVVEEVHDTSAKEKPSFTSADLSSSPFNTKAQKSATSAKNSKTKDCKKSHRSNGRKFNLGSRNIYTGANISEKTSSTILKGDAGSKAMLGGPSVATGIVGCIVM
ncbi:hypothetical protein MMC11_001003 [Xylographa trunciseda]|nr:hypothetical protein [Xylographa trunciseda]